MNDRENSEIEERLRDMQPAEPDPALRQRIASSLASGNTELERSFPFPKQLAYAFAAAACVVLAAVLWVLISQDADAPSMVDDTDPSEIDHPPAPGPSGIPTPHEARLVLMQPHDSLDQALDALLELPVGSAADSSPPMYTFADGRRLTRLENLP